MAYNNPEKTEFREIILSHIKKILELSTSELRNTSKTITGTHFTQIVDNEDTRISYIQSIKSLSYVLKPYFDTKITEKYGENMKLLKLMDFEIVEKYEDRIEEIKKHLKTKQAENYDSLFCSNKRVECAEVIFEELNLLLHRNDYLKKSTFSDSGMEGVIEAD